VSQLFGAERAHSLEEVLLQGVEVVSGQSVVSHPLQDGARLIPAAILHLVTCSRYLVSIVHIDAFSSCDTHNHKYHSRYSIHVTLTSNVEIRVRQHRLHLRKESLQHSVGLLSGGVQGHIIDMAQLVCVPRTGHRDATQLL
jgi:23S rRNA G2445 N2-methylase RlmL